jgi:tRNA threonylcarbamoyladenosine dehydratase
MSDYFQRLAMLTGNATVEYMQNCVVYVFGVGGVGSWCAEALVRSGVGNLYLIDADTVQPSNINRQLQASVMSIGKSKVEELAQRCSTINPSCNVVPLHGVYSAETRHQYNLSQAHYVIDAIDSVSHKIDLIQYAVQCRATLFSAMGAACKLDATRLQVAPIWKTHTCPLSRLVRQGLRKAGFTQEFLTVFSDEVLPNHALEAPSQEQTPNNTLQLHDSALQPPDDALQLPGKRVNGSAVHVTASAGMLLAGLVVQDAHQKAQP